MNVELKPCPFCGSTNIDAEGWGNSEGVKGPACDDCGSSVGGVFQTSEENVEQWNKRAELPKSDVPLHPIEVRINIGANGLAELKYLLDQIFCDEFDEIDTKLPQTISGGHSGSYSITCVSRDISADKYRAELLEWTEKKEQERAAKL